METVPHGAPIFSQTSPLTSTSAQGGPTFELPLGWDPKSGLGMPPELFNLASQGQPSSGGVPLPNTSATQPMAQTGSTSQIMNKEALISQLVNQMIIQNQPVSASQPIGQASPEASRVRILRIQYEGGTTYVCYDPVLGDLRHVNVPNPRSPLHLATTNALVSYQAPANSGVSRQPQAASAGQLIAPTRPRAYSQYSTTSAKQQPIYRLRFQDSRGDSKAVRFEAKATNSNIQGSISCHL